MSIPFQFDKLYKNILLFPHFITYLEHSLYSVLHHEEFTYHKDGPEEQKKTILRFKGKNKMGLAPW